MSVRSAEHVLPIVAEHFDVRSVVDFGCGRGGWLAAWKNLGVKSVLGVDGAYLKGQPLLIDDSEIQFADLSHRYDLGKRFDLVQSLEVAEHLPPASAESFVETLTRHGDIILFSAATPGQGGMHHVNERPLEYWRSIFNRFDFVAIDLVRPRIQQVSDVEPWYRYNSMIYAKRDRLPSFSAEIQSHIVPTEEAIKDYSPWSYRIRKMLIRPLPVRAVNWLATAKAAFNTSAAERDLTVRAVEC